ncbi:MAG: DUF3179 domain-containing protein, partial [Anaerolineales bacterium]|nr:DUF3179 domain-containing protein [Anaerolineales bacterium]
TAVPTLQPDEPPPAGAAAEFTTDFTRHSVPYDEILSGGPPKDGIPAIDDPVFEAVAVADAWLEPQEPVVLVTIGGEARAYPIQILIWHELVNDTVGGTPVVVSFCPLCNTAIVFERTFAGQPLTFGTTGRLRFSNLIMYDRQTETWWQQATGEAIAGEHTGGQLTFVPATIVAWADFRAAHPEGRVLSRDTGFARDYGRNPYPGYDDVAQPPFLYRGPVTPDQLPAVARVLAIDLDGEAVAYPYDLLSELGAVNDTVGGVEVAVFWATGTASALDAQTVAAGRDVGTAVAHQRALDGQTLTFVRVGDQIVDQETGSVWEVLGNATAGPLAGQALAPVTAVNHFWFSWAVFRPETRVYQP